MIKFVMGLVLGIVLVKFKVLPIIIDTFVDVGGADFVIENMEGLKNE